MYTHIKYTCITHHIIQSNPNSHFSLIFFNQCFLDAFENYLKFFTFLLETRLKLKIETL